MHENGHTTIILEHATTLLRSLETHEDISCTNAGITIARMVQQAVATINAANDAYDTQTQHGAKHGAAW
jgi:predicted secreted Zn-dependent protease